MSVRDILDALSAEGVHSVMVEGGASVISTFLRQGIPDTIAKPPSQLVQNVIITLCPVLLGGKRYAALEAGGEAGDCGGAVPRIAFPRLGGPLGSGADAPSYQQLGSDMVIHGCLCAPG